MKTIRSALLLGALGAVIALAPGGIRAAAPDTPPASAASSTAYDVNDCATCHDKAVTSFKATPHGRQEQSCSACHGDVTAHLQSNLEKGVPGPIQSMKGMKAADVNQNCLTCHDKGRQSNFTGGVHERRGVACTSCHSVHNFKSGHAQLTQPKDSQACFTCHADIRAKTMRTSHHPVREGKLDCASCHDPHDGATPKMIKAAWTTESCLTCHTEKRGPFLWEHAPVRENCALCHDPHGSNHDKLLVAKQPFLCQRCHLNTRHPGTLYDGGNTLAGSLVATRSGMPTVSNRAVEHACKNCHQSVHGGNAPSGPYFGR
jgi:DmsE family decaheme c-type cytochrome